MTRTRAAFTLTELLVALAVVLVIAGIAVIVVPGAVSQDRTTDGAATVRQHLMIAKNHAARDSLPRGIRFIVGLDPNTPAKSNPLWVTQLQYIETQPVLVPNQTQTTTFNPNAPPTGLTTSSPSVFVQYTTDGSGNITNRRVFIRNLTALQQADIQNGCLLGVPEFNNFWGRITGPINAGTGEVTLDNASLLLLDGYMGGSTTTNTYRFGIYTLPAPLTAQPNEVLPVNICVDLSMATGPNPVASPVYPYTRNPSTPAPQSNTLDYDILFAPNGQVINRPGMPVADGQIFLWVRDYTKGANPLVVTGPSPGAGRSEVYDMTPFRNGGEQQLVALKTKSGAMGVFPVLWPDQATGTYSQVPGAVQDPYSFARLGATGP